MIELKLFVVYEGVSLRIIQTPSHMTAGYQKMSRLNRKSAEAPLLQLVCKCWIIIKYGQESVAYITSSIKIPNKVAHFNAEIFEKSINRNKNEVTL